MAGWFIWGGTNFTLSASNIALEMTQYGPKLCADLRMHDGGSRGRQGIMLSDKIENRDGRLHFLVSYPAFLLLGLSAEWVLIVAGALSMNDE